MTETNLLQGKKGVVLGVANKRSIAWAISKGMSDAGAELAFTYQNEKLKGRVEDLVSTLPAECPLYPCDVTDDEQVAALGEGLGRDFGSIDFLVHCLAFASREDLERGFSQTSREGYLLAQEVSSYSLTAVSRMAAPLMKDGGSIQTLTYLGSERAVKNYNVMGVAKAALEASTRYLAYDLGPQKIRVNCISAGPMNTLAARGIAGFSSMLKHYEEHAPLKRNVEPAELGSSGVFLASDGAAAITGQVIYVDSGYQVMGM